jgi:hypothetical protein
MLLPSGIRTTLNIAADEFWQDNIIALFLGSVRVNCWMDE